ncbi:MAG: hypothetical protein AAFZ49_17280, partial [Cyanobacteria bacterium J06659_2]
FIPPQRINSMLNTFFGVLGQQSPDVANRFIKDRATWPEFNRMALTAASQNPALLGWIWQLAGPVDMVRWVGSYLTFTTSALLSWCLSWFPNWLHRQQAWLEPLWPAMWYSLLAKSYGLTYGTGKPSAVQVRIQAPTVESLRTPRPKQPRRSVSEATADDERSPQPDIPQTDMPQPDMKVIR